MRFGDTDARRRPQLRTGRCDAPDLLGPGRANAGRCLNATSAQTRKAGPEHDSDWRSSGGSCSISSRLAIGRRPTARSSSTRRWSRIGRPPRNPRHRAARRRRDTPARNDVRPDVDNAALVVFAPRFPAARPRFWSRWHDPLANTCQGGTTHGRACLSFRYSVAAPMPSFSAALARLPPEARSAAAM